MSRASDEAVVGLLARRVHQETGFDLAGYRTDGLVRRARQRAAVTGAESLEEYLPRVDQGEARLLLQHALVQVSGWFRDPWVWQSLLEVVLPGIAHRSGGPADLRVWVAGCGSGQEVYSLAACLDRSVRAGHVASWEVLATDVDRGALAAVGAATYPSVELPGPGRELLLPHVQQAEDGTWRVGGSLRAHVRTAHHDVREAPPEELGGPADLVLCRNVLMYLDAPVQAEVLDGLLASVRPGGVLVLGHAELPLGHRHALVPVDLRARAYRSIAVALPQEEPTGR